MKWCADHGIPHSEFLEWAPDDRSKLMAYLLDESERCSMCGSSQWEWDQDKFAYEAAAHTCRGCQILDASREDNKPGPGVRMILIPKAKAQAQRMGRV